MGEFYEKPDLKKVRPLFGPFLTNQAKVRPLTFPAPPIFFSALFVLCGRNFGHLATLVSSTVECTLYSLLEYVIVPNLGTTPLRSFLF
jgi:hypothetical protein